VLTWDRVELATGAVRHETVPAEAEPPGAFAAIVGEAPVTRCCSRMPSAGIRRCASPMPSTPAACPTA
jgi:hypothetical protein